MTTHTDESVLSVEIAEVGELGSLQLFQGDFGWCQWRSSFRRSAWSCAVQHKEITSSMTFGRWPLRSLVFTV